MYIQLLRHSLFKSFVNKIPHIGLFFLQKQKNLQELEYLKRHLESEGYIVNIFYLKKKKNAEYLKGKNPQLYMFLNSFKHEVYYLGLISYAQSSEVSFNEFINFFRSYKEVTNENNFLLCLNFFGFLFTAPGVNLLEKLKKSNLTHRKLLAFLNTTLLSKPMVFSFNLKAKYFLKVLSLRKYS
jgi:hypothetical protein